jgi:hypothetical protein
MPLLNRYITYDTYRYLLSKKNGSTIELMAMKFWRFVEENREGLLSEVKLCAEIRIQDFLTQSEEREVIGFYHLQMNRKRIRRP